MANTRYVPPAGAVQLRRCVHTSAPCVTKGARFTKLPGSTVSPDTTRYAYAVTNRAAGRCAFAGGTGSAVRLAPAATVAVPMTRACIASWLVGSSPGTFEVAQFVPDVR